MERSLDGDRSSPVLQTRWEHSHDYDGPQQEPGRWPGRSDGSGLGKGERADPISVLAARMSQTGQLRPKEPRQRLVRFSPDSGRLSTKGPFPRCAKTGHSTHISMISS